MSTESPAVSAPHPGGELAGAIARWGLGLLFIYMGWHKAVHPVEFLKLVRQYDLVEQHVWLNLIAACLPWFEIFCGLLLTLGIAVRGVAVIMVAMLVPFTLAILFRALAVQKAGGWDPLESTCRHASLSIL